MRCCLIGLVLALASCLSPAAEEKQDAEDLLRQARPSVALLVVESNGKVWDATGFVVARPKDGMKMLLTNAHILKGARVEDAVVSAKLPGMPDFKPCEFLARSEEHDLMALALPRGVNPPALPVFGEQNPKRGESVLIIGNPGGWSWSDYSGRINADPITRAQLFADRELREDRELKKVIVLRHSVPSYPGMSGAPVMDLRGMVVGVNLGTMSNADQVGFCIHNKHIENLPVTQKTQAFARREGPKSDVNEILGAEGKVTPHANLRIDGREISVGWLHLGYVPPQAPFILKTFIQEQDRFKKLFPEDRLQKILKDRQVAHLVNPAIGCRMLVPKGVRYQTLELPKDLDVVAARGMKFEFTTDDLRVAAEYRTVTMLTIDDPDLYLRALTKAKATKRPPDSILPPTVLEFAATQSNMLMEVRSHIRQAVHARVQHIKDNGDKIGTPWGDPEDELFVSAPAQLSMDFKPLICRWRENYDSTTSGNSYAIHVLIRGRSMIVLYHRFRTSEREAFFTGKPVSDAFRDKMFMMGSFGMY